MAGFAQIPDLNSAHVKAFCRSISNLKSPILLEINPTKNAQALYCFQNVDNHTKTHGGKIQFGYSIWEYQKLYIEAEHHAVWISVTGDYIDITPSSDGDTHRLFLPDDSAVYNFDRPDERRDNIRKALVNDRGIRQYFELSQLKFTIMSSYPGIGDIQITVSDAERLMAIDKQRSDLIVKSHLRHFGPNGPCFCGSGRKFKKCHGARA